MLTPTIFKKRALIEAVVLGVLCMSAWAVSSHYDFFEVLVSYVANHEEYQLDEVIVGLLCVGTGSFAFAILRSRELLLEVRARIRAEGAVSWLASHDSLTRLGNRRGLDIALDDAHAALRQRDYTIHSIDLDGFKNVNDMLGHDIGDQVLFEAAQRLTKVYEGMSVFRAGGDEFVVLQPSGNEVIAQRTADAAIAALAEPMQLLDTGVMLSGSIGYATASFGGVAVRSALQNADAAMYVAKRSGRNQTVRFDGTMNVALRRRIELENGLRQALRDRTIDPHFQPLIDLKTQDIRGFEALARWSMQNGEVVSPMEFITLAEETGLISELGDQLLLKACREAAKWPSHVTLAFNVSPVQFRDPQLGLRILQILSETGLPASRLEIEITETALMKNLSQAEVMLGALHAAGIRVALDDFGTGYSSLAQLSRFRFDKIKIDRSFVAAFEKDETQAKILRAMLGLGQGLGLTMTAEGIERESQLAALAELGCETRRPLRFWDITMQVRIRPAARDGMPTEAFPAKTESPSILYLFVFT
jgi:diguanylate cyclase (GGDEF)-like protein